MGARLLVVLAFAAACSGSISAQAPQTPDGVDALLSRLQVLLQSGDREGFAALVGPTISADQVEEFSADLFQPGIRRAVVSARDRAQLDGSLPGDGFRLVVEIFTETTGRGRIVTVLFDVRRPYGGDADAWRVTAARGVTSVEGLYRLRVNSSAQFGARNLTITAEDLVLTLEQGLVFQVESEQGVTGLALFGRGTMKFSPAPQTEKGQLKIFGGSEALITPFDSVFVRLNPREYEQRVTVGRLTPAPVNPRDLRRAQDMLAREAPKSFSLDLSDLSSEAWYLMPQPGDFLAEIHTRRHGMLTYSRSGAQMEDITLFERQRGRTIALYPSVARLAARSDSYHEDGLRDYDVIDYNVDANVSPQTERIDARVRVRLKVLAPALSTVTLRLSDDLTVSGVASAEYGRLLHLRVRNQNSIIVNLPVPLERDDEFTLVVAYSGHAPSLEIRDEGVQGGRGGDDPQFRLEPIFLLSSRSYWYPQNTISDYATATLRITVPEGFGCVASGVLRTDSDVTLRDLLTLTEGKSYVFTAPEPLRYLALIVSPFVRVGETTIDVAHNEDHVETSRLQLAVEANPRQQQRGRDLMATAEAIIRFYGGLIGDVPYSSAAIALVENALPGGHSPGYFAVLNTPVPGSRFLWRDDPAMFSGFPDFFIAHELAHQWWGQAIGWRNYHEQWLSEGFAQYFAALYAQHTRGERTFNDMLRQFRRWAVAESDEGPISLGYRLGHIKSDQRVFRALVYNKGAAVLHMLRLLVGDEAFFNALRRYYAEQKFRKAGTDDLRQAFEAESGRSLSRFFERWIDGAAVPRLRFARVVSPAGVTVRFDQVGDELFDLPVTVTLVYANGRRQDIVVPVTERHVERRIPTDGVVRQVQINRDYAAVAYFEES
jgi:hypothetical protein